MLGRFSPSSPKAFRVDDPPTFLQIAPAAADDERLVTRRVADIENEIVAAGFASGDIEVANARWEAGEGGAQAIDRFGGEVLCDALDVHTNAGLSLIFDGGEELFGGLSHGLSGCRRFPCWRG